MSPRTDHLPLVDEIERDAQEEVDDIVRNHIRSEQEDQHEHACPTELLQEDAIVSGMELPSHFRELGVASLIARRPAAMLCGVYFVALVAFVWVLLTPGERFSVSEDLFIAQHDPDVSSFYDQAILRTASTQLRADRLDSAIADHLDSVPRRRRLTRGIEAVTLVYERRGISSRNVLGLRQLKTIHDFEQRLWEWSVQSGTCSTEFVGSGSTSHGCQQVDSIISYLYPSVETSPTTGNAAGGQRKLHFDGHMRVENPSLLSACAEPPFSAHDVAETLAWLASQRHDGNVEDDEARADEDDAEELSTESHKGAYSRYLRSTLYLASDTMSTGRWYQLASMLYAFSSRPWSRSWYVRTYYGGPTGLMTAGLLVLLTYDLLLLLCAIGAVGLYFRVYFGRWRLALLASLQILASFPVMLFVACVLLRQTPLSAFAATSLWVVVGVVSSTLLNSIPVKMMIASRTRARIHALIRLVKLKVVTIVCSVPLVGRQCLRLP